MQTITLYSHSHGPNPWKVALILEELNIPYETKLINFTEVKQEPYISLNPNGRLPSIVDPNTGLKLWESGAIVEYLCEQYDTGYKISFESLQQRNECRQWLFFQVSGQAPYYGQASWFMNSHSEKVQSAVDRYVGEIHRINGVLNRVLSQGEWLVGDKCSVADLCFLGWQRWAPKYGGADIYEHFPRVEAWVKRMEARPTVEKVYRDQDKAISEAKGL